MSGGIDNQTLNDLKKICKTGKVKFVSEASAIAADDYRGDGLFAYKCPHCKFWHLTRQRQRKRNDND